MQKLEGDKYKDAVTNDVNKGAPCCYIARHCTDTSRPTRVTRRYYEILLLMSWLQSTKVALTS